MKKVSIIVPVFNTELYLGDALNSIKEQTYSDYEVIIINDGSTDRSADVINEFLSDERFICFTQENKGLSVARNRGIEYATGDFIYFFDSDDKMAPDLLERAIYAFSKGRADIFLFSALTFGDQSDFNYQRVDFENELKFTDFICDSIAKKAFNPSACMYISKSDLIKKYRFTPNIIHEDNSFFIDLFLNNPDMIACVSPYQGFYRRVRAGSIMQSKKTMKNFLGYYHACEKLCDSENSKGVGLLFDLMHRSAVLCLYDVNGSDRIFSKLKVLHLSIKFMISTLSFNPKLLARLIYMRGK